MRAWNYVESPEDGDVWLDNLHSVSGCIEYRSPNSGEPRRIMVATKNWLDAHLLSGAEGGRPSWTVVPSILIVTDGTRSEIEAAIDRAVKVGALDGYSVLVTEKGA
jgi:hypothetical protein